MKINEAFWEIFRAISNREIRFHDFNAVGVNEDYYDYFYAEDELYVIRDRIFDTIEFVRARSPKEALQKFHEVREEVFRPMKGADDGDR